MQWGGRVNPSTPANRTLVIHNTMADDIPIALGYTTITNADKL